ncbi:MAG: TPM domain-containing protein [Bacteroidetes bacterium]|nr:TPM domain-containing protein [Bacteroidota bacterium]
MACTACSFSSLAQKAVPELWGQRVHDEAHILKAETVDQLEKDLASYEDSTSNQIAILIIQSLEGEVLEDFSIKVAEKWKLGSKKNDNGVLLLIAVDDHKMRIEVGQGLEGALTDAHSNRIIRNEMAPEFRRGDYDAGVLAAIISIKAAIRGEYAAEDASNNLDDMDPTTKWIIAGVIFLFLGIFAGVGLFSDGVMTWILYAFLTPFYAVFLGLMFSWWIFGGYLIVYPLLRLWIAKSGKKLLKWESASGGSGGSSSGSGWSSGGSSWSSSSSSSSSSSFSGGGGSFGGGGSSGSW